MLRISPPRTNRATPLAIQLPFRPVA
ncbi:protein of unknown function [Azospirillum baldaniorum]|uniref:Uncharacterized protein n=1 Tax=Azospirillum baldaniorum TaxID=1064539 RepID=A0A9P1NMF4_9PROT|nr:protein of unknown function [Azospirillum baldaniorum]